MRAPELERVIRRASDRRTEAAEHCDLCGEPVPAEHRHLLDTANQDVQCCCQACSLLFERDAASEGHYRRLPRRRKRLPPVPTETIGVPVGIAYVVAHAGGVVVAHYPSPVGPTESELEPARWQALLDEVPDLRDMDTDVEALLVNTAHGAREFWLVPIDDCFRLVALVRGEWRGLSGGSTVWPEIERFFTELTERT
ncbi:DUF5947 family protein [Haloechinothrix salitolerans]|uniref:DUF5947 family protein n=1 Tax=Haloechinothrix salitolerans TaxID=926830 RepID=A0ABW2C234_9PSEU